MAPSAWDILGAIGAATGAPALAWQAFTWTRAQPKLVVTASNGFPVYGGRPGAHHFCVSVTNTGGAPTEITAWGFRLPDGSTMVVPRPPPFSDRPGRIEPHGRLTFYAEGTDVIEACRQRGLKASELVPFVTMTTGRQVTGNRLPWKD